MSARSSTSNLASSPAIESFQHEPLTDPANHIRLLEITSVDETRDPPVHCKLTTWPVETAPLYTAISYTWGDPRQLTSVLVNGRPMEVRHNCEYVLKQAWWQKGGGYVWVDAICISQADNDEKSSQVAMMGDVYDRAGQVLACVGRHEDDSDFVFEMLLKQQHWWRQYWGGPWDANKFNTPRWRGLMCELDTVRLCNALNMFLKRSYFHRVWVLQELFFGKIIQVCCGHDTADLPSLRGLFLALRGWADFSREYLRIPNIRAPLVHEGVEFLLKIGAFSSPYKIDVDLIMIKVRPCQSEDPRDRIFGVLSIIQWNGRKPIQPDYSRDRWYLGVEILLCTDHFGEIEVLLRYITRIAQILDWIKIPPTRLIDAIQERRSSHGTALPSGSRLTLGASSLMLARFWGHRLCFQDTRWRIQPRRSKDADGRPRSRLRSPENLRGDSFEPMVQKWAAGHSWDILSADILLPQETQSEDWFLAPSHIYSCNPTSDAIGRSQIDSDDVAFIDRKDGDGRPQLVGKALVVPWKKWPTRSVWGEAWATKGTQYAVYLDPEDAIILAYSLSWPEDRTEDWNSLEKDGAWLEQRAGQYFETRLCGQRNCSYAVPAES